MYIIADTGAVRRRIVVAKNRDLLPLPKSYLEDDRNEMRLRRMVFSQVTIRAGARRVEVPKRRVAQAISLGVIGQRSFDDQFAETIGINRKLRLVFGDGDPLGSAV